jgi:hypothetical protein
MIIYIIFSFFQLSFIYYFTSYLFSPLPLFPKELKIEFNPTAMKSQQC